ncbi:hypothetical protein AKI39_22825 [Bordetella sp. H567]|uniref:hypothetical protein n=1 Tax=Bordetella sp. H567 TaxID=1697043 RepID=UPI00081CDF9A|nr:hypothetical protein [Bordetella sp. H567]AOB32969.1 hypothetical protein AKI39_22825 [Bordetella sp. H567]
MSNKPDGIPAYVVLTSKPGLYRSEPTTDVEIVETYDYVFYGRTKAVFQIARVVPGAKVRIVEDAPPHIENLVPVRVMEQFASLPDARRAVGQLANFGTLEATLVRR